MIREFRKLAGPLHRRVMLMLGRGIIRLVNDAARVQEVQATLLAGEMRDGLERFQEYGFTSHPLPGMEALVAFVGGSRDHGVVVAIADRQFRLKQLAAGEVALYTDEGDTIVLKRGRTIEIDTMTLLVKAGAKARFETPQLEVTGNIIDRVDSDGRTMRAMRSTYDTHTHPGDSGGTTGAPTQKMNP